jgi:hypothetical protein
LSLVGVRHEFTARLELIAPTPALARISRLPTQGLRGWARSLGFRSFGSASAPFEDVTGPLADRAECPVLPLNRVRISDISSFQRAVWTAS